MIRPKIKDIFNLDIIIDGDRIETLFDSSTWLNCVYANGLALYGITSEDWDESILKTILTPSEGEKDLDLEYFVERSAEKLVSNYCLRLYEKYGLKDKEPDDNDWKEFYYKLQIVIARKFGFKWWKICNALVTNYKPLENYDMNEVRTPNLTENTKRNQLTDMNVHQESESGIYGFNSTNSNPTATGSGDTHTTGFKNKNETEDVKTNTGTESLTRHGNIGVTTSQQMLESEIVLREKHNLLDIIFKDIDSILCLKVY